MQSSTQNKVMAEQALVVKRIRWLRWMVDDIGLLEKIPFFTNSLKSTEN